MIPPRFERSFEMVRQGSRIVHLSWTVLVDRWTVSPDRANFRQYVQSLMTVSASRPRIGVQGECMRASIARAIGVWAAVAVSLGAQANRDTTWRARTPWG